jgi:hypothetical protein
LHHARISLSLKADKVKSFHFKELFKEQSTQGKTKGTLLLIYRHPLLPFEEDGAYFTISVT